MRGQFDCVAINWKKTPFEPTKFHQGQGVTRQTLTVVSERRRLTTAQQIVKVFYYENNERRVRKAKKIFILVKES